MADIMRVLQLVISILGLVFAILSNVPQPMLLIVGFAICLVYLIIMLITSMSGRTLFSGSAVAIIDLILGIIILVFTIYVLSVYIGTWNIMTIIEVVCGFVLPALLFITAYDSM